MRAHFGLGTKGWGIGVFPGAGRGIPVSLLLSGRAAGHVFPIWGTLRGWLCTRSLWNGECSPILYLGMPTSSWSEGLCGLLQTELLLDVRGMWLVQQEVDEGHLSSSRLCGFELHLHTHTGIPSHQNLLNFIDLIMKQSYSFLIPETCLNAFFFRRSTSPLWFILKWLLEGVILVMKC